MTLLCHHSLCHDMNVHHYKHIKLLIVGMIQATHIPQVKATQVLNMFYYPYTVTQTSVYFGQGLVAPLNHQHITYLNACKNHTVYFRHGLLAPLIHQSILQNPCAGLPHN